VPEYANAHAVLHSSIPLLYVHICKYVHIINKGDVDVDV